MIICWMYNFSQMREDNMYGAGFVNGYIRGYTVGYGVQRAGRSPLVEQGVRPRSLLCHLITHTMNVLLCGDFPITLQKLHDFLISIPHGANPANADMDTFFNKVFLSAHARSRFHIEAYYQKRYGVNTIEEAVEKLASQSSDEEDRHCIYAECMNRYCDDIEYLPDLSLPKAFIPAYNFFSECYISLTDKELRASTDNLFTKMIHEASKDIHLLDASTQAEAMTEEIDSERLFAYFMKIIDNTDGPVMLPAIADPLEFYRNRT